MGITVGAEASAGIHFIEQEDSRLIEATGEYSVEAWVAPRWCRDKSYMVSYSGGDTLRNFTLGQTNQNYDFLMRSSASDLNGMPQLQTRRAMVLQASLQHVVLTTIRQWTADLRERPSTALPTAEGRTISNWTIPSRWCWATRYRATVVAGPHQVRRHP